MNQYSVFILPDKKYITITKQTILSNYPVIQNRDFRLFKNDISSEISLLFFRENILLIKLDIISVILSDNKCIFFKFNECHSNHFIQFITKLEIVNTISFSMNLFEGILLYLSQQSDIFLESSFKQFSKFSINKTNQNELIKIITLQHSVLIELNKYREFLESLRKLTKIELLFFCNSDNKTLYEIQKIISIYDNRFQEDIKNLERLLKRIEIFVNISSVSLSQTRTKYTLSMLYLTVLSVTYSFSCIFFNIFGMNFNNTLETEIYPLPIFSILSILLNIPIFFILKHVFI